MIAAVSRISSVKHTFIFAESITSGHHLIISVLFSIGDGARSTCSKETSSDRMYKMFRSHSSSERLSCSVYSLTHYVTKASATLLVSTGEVLLI